MSSSSSTREAKESDPLMASSNKDSEMDGDWDLGLRRWWLKLRGSVGYELLVILFFSQHIGRGFVDNLTTSSYPYIYRKYHVPATRVQIYEGVQRMPWAFKPIIGLLSDLVPIAGYNKAPYMMIFTVCGIVACLCVGFNPASTMPVLVVTVCFLFLNFMLSTNDILTEAKYAEKIRESPEVGPSLMTYVWSGMNVTGLGGIVLAGVLAAHSPTSAYIVSAVVTVPILAPLLMGFMTERRMDSKELADHRERFAQQGETVFLGLLMFVACVLLAAVGLIFGDPAVNAAVALAAALAVLVSFAVLLTPVLAKFAAFQVLQSSLSLSVTGASFYFMTDSPEQYPEGPHFSEFFYTSVMQIFGVVMSVIGVAAYQRYMSTWRYRPLYMVSNLVFTAVSFLDVIFFARLNVKVGIPDHAFALSTSAVQQLIFQWQWMPSVVLLSYLCPPGMEATMYAMLAGCHNIGLSISSILGSFLLRVLEIRPNGSLQETEQFRNLWIAALIAMVLPLITVVALIHLIPEGRQGEELPGLQSATEGSLWRRWRDRSAGGPAQV